MGDRENKIDYAPILKKRIREILIEKNWTVDDLIEKSGLSEDTIDNLYYGRSHDPRISTLLQLSEALGVSVNCLMGKCQHTSQERVLLKNYRGCGKHGKAIVELIAAYEFNAMRDKEDKNGNRLIPCIVPHGDIVHGIMYELSETVEIMTNVDDADIAIEMITNDFVPHFYKGDQLLFERRFPKHGEVGAFYNGKRLLIRQYLEEGKQYRLRCLHKKGYDIVLNHMNEINCMGTCVDVVRS